MNLKLLQLLIFFLLISQKYRFANANDDDDDDKRDDIFAKKQNFTPKPESEALRALREYINILCNNWNGFFYELGSNNSQILDTYLRHVSSVYARVLHLYDYNYDEISRTMHEQFMAYIVPRMSDVTHFNIDSPIQEGPVVAQYITTDGRLQIDDDLRREIWSSLPRRTSPPIDRIVPEDELESLIRLRVPYSDRRPNKPYFGWEKSANPDSDTWPGLSVLRDISWNHLIPYAQVNYLLESYNRLWLRNNRGNLWYSDTMLIQLEIRLSRLVILRADLGMGKREAERVLTDDSVYLKRASAYNGWPAGNLFIGPFDNARRPRPGQQGEDRFEAQAAEILRPEGWAQEGLDLTRAILDFEMVPESDQTLRECLQLLDRYSRLLRISGSSELWAETGRGIAPASPAQYDIGQTHLGSELLEEFEHQVSKDVRHNEQRALVSKEYERLRQNLIPEAVIRDVIDEELKAGGWIFRELEGIRERKLEEMVSEYFTKKKIFRYTFTGPKYSIKWQAIQKTSECASKRLNVETKICDQNILFDAIPSTSSSPGVWSVGSGDNVFDFDNLKLVEDDSGVGSSVASSRRQSEVCGATWIQENVIIDPTITLTSAPRDLSNLRDVDEAYNNDVVEDIKRVQLDGCLYRNGTDSRRFREKRTVTLCSMEVVNEIWEMCKKLIMV